MGMYANGVQHFFLFTDFLFAKKKKSPKKLTENMWDFFYNELSGR